MTKDTKGAVHVWVASVEGTGVITAAMVNRAEGGGVQMDVVTGLGSQLAVTVTLTNPDEIHQLAMKMMQIAFELAQAKGQG